MAWKGRATMHRARRERRYYTYIMANVARTIYVGVTSNLEARVYQHQQKSHPGFTSRYGLDRLVYAEETTDVREAIAREKQIKGWRRAKKVALIESVNPKWEDLSAEWYGGTDSSLHSE